MADQLSKDDVIHVAKLSRLRLSDDEIEHFGKQLSDVLGYMSKLNELDVEGVEPMAHALDVTNVWRQDTPEPGMDTDTALGNAPQRADAFFQVPKVLGDASGA